MSTEPSNPSHRQAAEHAPEQPFGLTDASAPEQATEPAPGEASKPVTAPAPEQTGASAPEQSPKPKELPGWAYRLLLIAATIIWGGNFVVSKIAIDAAGATWVVGIRFLVAGIFMLVALLPHMRAHMNRSLLKAGCIIGLFSFLGYWTQFVGLEGTTPAKNAFLSACYCVTVPFIWWVVVKRRPTAQNLLAAAICVTGMALVTLKGDLQMSWGDGVSILSAFMYGGEIVVIALYIRNHDVLAITAVQMVVSGVLGCLLGAATAPPPSLDILTDPGFLAAMAYIILLASCFASTAQNMAQTHVPPAEVSLLFALESVFGTIFSVLFYGEIMTGQLLAGFALIFAGIIVSQHRQKSQKKCQKRSGKESANEK